VDEITQAALLYDLVNLQEKMMDEIMVNLDYTTEEMMSILFLPNLTRLCKKQQNGKRNKPKNK
jgi:hypothetical protein